MQRAQPSSHSKPARHPLLRQMNRLQEGINRRLAEYPGNPVHLAAGAARRLGEIELHAVGASRETVATPGVDIRGRVLHAGNTFSDASSVTLGALQSRCDRSRYGYCLQGLVMVFSPAGGLQYSTFAGGECHRAQVCASARPGPSAPVAWATTD